MQLELMCEHVHVIGILQVILVWSLQFSLYGTWHSHQKTFTCLPGCQPLANREHDGTKNRFELTHNNLPGYCANSKNCNGHD